MRYNHFGQAIGDALEGFYEGVGQKSVTRKSSISLSSLSNF
ncbi:hypothetical protein [Streptococcus cuniculi]|nr:hypothetical protein [Streptococcus cuniculi]